MNMMTKASPDRQSGVEFHGRWQEFLGIAVINLLLTVLTLGIYRFWAQAKVRRYLWSRTRLLGTELEWTGTGGEMFKGFLIAIGVILAYFAATFVASMLVGKWVLFLGLFAFYIGLAWAIGFAQFRAMRYRLSRTYWRGIRGGSDDNGVNYGWTALGRNLAAGITAGLATPWALTENWNDRVNAMSFGSDMMQSRMDTEGLMARWLMIYPVYIGLIGFAMWTMPDPAAGETATILPLLLVFAAAIGVGLVMLAFWSLWFRKAAEAFSLGDLEAGFDATTVQWMAFYAKVVGLVVVTLGLGLLVVPYLRWKFVTDHLALFGTVDVDTLTQSTTHAPGEAEGFLDALDIGAF